MRQSDSRSPQPDFSLSHFIQSSPSPAHAVHESISQLQAKGAIQLRLDEPWHLSPDTLYFLAVSTRSLCAFRTTKTLAESFRLISAHTDSPCLRVRERSIHWENGLLVSSTEPYGGAIYNTWLDRPLRISGTVILSQGHDLPRTCLIELTDIQGIIPNLAIHLNRDINKGFEFNPQTQLKLLLPLAANEENRQQPWEWMVARQLTRDLGQTVSIADILALDLWLADAQEPVEIGNPAELINAPRLDNLAGCHAAVQALLGANVHVNQLQMVCLFDHEEVGSRSLAGADSGLLNRVLRRIALAIGLASEETYLIAVEKSLMASVDAAHATHPSFAEKHDPAYAPVMNGGVVLKSNVNQRYATQLEGSAHLRVLCKRLGIAVQNFTNRADMACGSTIGPSLSAHSGIKTIDLGIALLAMHSCRETAGLRDQEAMIEILSAFLEDE